MPTGDRDRVVDQLLRSSAGDLLAVPGPDCLDAETLAAWHEGGLDRTMARRIEGHLATCARCQTMAAAFARADVTAPVPAPAPWGLRWIVPVSVAATAAAAIWVFVPRQSGEPVTDQKLAMNEPAVPTAGPANPERRPAANPNASAEGGAAPVASTELTTPQAPSASADVPPADGRGNRAAKAETAAVAALRDEPLAPAPPRTAPPPVVPAAVAAPPVLVPQVPSQRESVNVTAEAPLIQAQSGERSTAASTTQVENLPINRGNFTNLAAMTPGAAPGDAVGRTDRLGGAGQNNIQMDGVSAMDTGGMARVVVEFAAAAAPSATAGAEPPPAPPGAVRPAGLEVRIAPPPTRWRVLADGRVQRSLTEGASWDAIALDASTRVTTGAAPSPMVCWLVGPRGVVLRTSDRLHFQRLAFPETVDLSAIQATSDLAATVTTGDGRAFATTDGGKTWRAGGR